MSVYLSVTGAGCVKTDERIDILFKMGTIWDPRNIELDGNLHPTTASGLKAAFVKLLWPPVNMLVNSLHKL